jgi:hypothetical protein
MESEEQVSVHFLLRAYQAMALSLRSLTSHMASGKVMLIYVYGLHRFDVEKITARLLIAD